MKISYKKGNTSISKKTAWQKWRKVLLVLGVLVFSLVVIAIAFISPITKYLVEKYDEKYTGRRITMDWAYVNPFTGYLQFRNMKIYELKSDSVFFSSKGFGVNIEVWKLFSGTYEISKFELVSPRGMILQNGRIFNFSDIVDLFIPKDKPKKAQPPVRFSVLNIRISNGEFYYSEKLVPLHYYIKNVDIESSGKHWDNDTMETKISFTEGIGGGEVKANIAMNVSTLNYKLTLVVNKFSLGIINQYLKDLSNYGSVSAQLNADIKAQGNFKDEEDITASGKIAVTDFHFGKTPSEDYTSFNKLVVSIRELSPKKYKYIFDSISLSKPYFKYERYDNMDNLSAMFGHDGAVGLAVDANPYKFNLILEIGKYVKALARNFIKSYYKIDRLAIYNGDFRFNDYALGEKFSMDFVPVFFYSNNIDKNKGWATGYCSSGVKPYGNVSLSLRINPKDTGDFDIQYHLQKLPIAMFNPYIIAYTSYPVDRGTLEFKGSWNVRGGVIRSKNHLIVIDPRLTRRQVSRDASWLPVPLIVAFIREQGNIIDYEIPITGNLRDPKFHWRDVIFDLIRNVFVKPMTTPYRIQVKNLEEDIEMAINLRWDLKDAGLQAEQRKFIERMATYLARNKEARITIFPQFYSVKEREYILLYEARKQFYIQSRGMASRNFTKADSLRVSKMSIKDTFFVKYLNKFLNGALIYTAQGKCELAVSPSLINEKLNQLASDREKAFLLIFKKERVDDRVKMSKAVSIVPYNGFSYYKIEYVGALPEVLKRAYSKMNELNDAKPRRKFKAKRKNSENN